MKTISILIVSIIYFLFSHSLNPQEIKYIMNAKGKFIPLNEFKNYTPPNHKDSLKRNIFGDILFSPNDVRDTLRYGQDIFDGNINFGFFGQDRMIQWFVAPADMTIEAVGVECVVTENADTPVELKLVNFAWDYYQLSLITRAKYLGYYPATGNNYNDVTAYLDDPDRTGDWVDVTGEGLTSPFGSNLWSYGDSGYTFIPVPDPTYEEYNWIQMNIINEPDVLRGKIIGVSVKNLHPVMDESRIGWYAIQSAGLPLAFKFYQNGRFTAPPDTASDEGWWARDFSWDFALAVILTGDVPPAIESFTKLGTTLSTDARTVDAVITDDNLSGGEAGVASAVLYYSIDGGRTWMIVLMSGTEPNYTADIPGQAAGTEVTYKISATDVNDNTAETLPTVYNIFVKQNDILFIYNASDFGDATASHFYLGGGTAEPLDHDLWSTGIDGVDEIDDLLALYDAVLEVGGSFPNTDISGNIETWITTGTMSNPKSFFMSNQDFGCFISGCADTTFSSGSFEHDYLGIAALAPQDFSNGNNADMQIKGVAGDPVSDWVEDYSTANSVNYWYNSSFELGFTNWIDALTPAPGATPIFLEPSTGNVVGVRNSGTGWYTTFLAYDYLGCDFLSDTSLAITDDPGYAQGVSVASQAYRFFIWTLPLVDVEQENELLPDVYHLSQNYPNPFNPGTTIKFSIPEASNVVLKVYDILGSEVAVLVNEKIPAGNYKVEFDASKLASGMYIYSLKAGEFSISKKMILMK